MLNQPFQIDISSELSRLDVHLQNNPRTILSAKFGDGKTYFLKKYIAERGGTLFITLRPVNYVVLPNEDIFEYIKRDILAFLVKEKEFNEIDWKQAISEIYNYETILESVEGLADLIGPGAKFCLTPFHWFKKIDDKYAIDKYFDRFKHTKGGLFEFDNFSFAIQTTLSRIKEKGRKCALIIEDLDRIDPEHLFRILNVLGAHVDEDTESNKFGFDNIVAVLDYDTTRHIFHHFYGEKANYEGYMTKFMSHNPFYYSVTYEARKYLLQLLRERCGLTDEFFTENFLIEEKNTVQNISINYKINCSTIREIEQILMDIKAQYNVEDFVLADGRRIKSDVPIVLFLAVLVRMKVKIKLSGFVNLLIRKQENMHLFGSLPLIIDWQSTTIGNKQYRLKSRMSDNYVEVDWEWFMGGDYGSISIETLVTNLLEKVFARVYDSQQLLYV